MINYANIEAAQQLGFQTIHLAEGISLEEVLKAKAIL
jgi:2-haloacid dehalogenase